jgi:mannose-1-phosphate guanylyltransferase/mannose-6-phosphate isomerase
MKIMILAGGSGTRLWPLSRKRYAKQFLNLIGEDTMIQETALRVKSHSIHVVTDKESSVLVEDQLSRVIPFFSRGNIIVEPMGRNTAPAIGYGASFFSEEDIIAVLPADHHIEKEEEFQKLLSQAEGLAKKGYIVTFGIVPHRPETGYGYIKVTDQKTEAAWKVDSFKEKPDKATAEEYLQEGRYYWNSGMFVFSVKTLMEELEKNSPEIYRVLEKVGGKEAAPEEYGKFPDISIDYAVMEKTDNLVLLESDIGWSDIGGFEALWENLPKDKNQNAVKGEMDLFSIDSTGNLFFSMTPKKIFSAIGVKDLVVVDTGDALLVASKKESQNVKKVVESLKEQKRDEAFLHTKVHRPWGYYVNIREEEGFKIKKIVVYPGERLSLQSHEKRSESWTIVRGEAEVTVNHEVKKMKKGDNILIPLKARHRLANPAEEALLEIVEVQMGSYLGEDDITRYEDDYQRS